MHLATDPGLGMCNQTSAVSFPFLFDRKVFTLKQAFFCTVSQEQTEEAVSRLSALLRQAALR